MELWLHLFHITSAVIWVGGGLALTLIGLRIQRSGEIAVLADFARTVPFVGMRALSPSMIVLLVTGVWIVFAEGAGDFRKLRIALALVGFALAFLIGAVVLGRSAIRFERLTSSPAPDLVAARGALGARVRGYAVVLAILLFVLWDMVFKPTL